MSIPSNIAEGYERDSRNDFIRFLNIAKGSCAELITQLEIAISVNLLTRQNIEPLIYRLTVLSAKIGKLISYLKKVK